MIVLDTNVFSDLVRHGRTGWASAWLNTVSVDRLWTTTITAYELEFGVRLMPVGRKRTDLENRIRQLLWTEFEDRILPLDGEASKIAAILSARRKTSGLNIGIQDTLMAGIALSRGAAVATRNLKDFADAGLELIDPLDQS